MAKNKRYYDRWLGKWVDGDTPEATGATNNEPTANPVAEMEPAGDAEVTPVPTWGADWFNPNRDKEDE